MTPSNAYETPTNLPALAAEAAKLRPAQARGKLAATWYAWKRPDNGPPTIFSGFLVDIDAGEMSTFGWEGPILWRCRHSHRKPARARACAVEHFLALFDNAAALAHVY